MKINQGWINLYKPKNISSFNAINVVKKNLSLNKIGHAGTLDPQAEGVLPIAIGKTTKLIPFINSNLKVYNFAISWGFQTSTDDSSGDILFSSNNIPLLSEINKKLNNFIGNFEQVPPNVSAIKINGKRAYKLSRDKIDFKIMPKNVFVKKLEVIKHQNSKTFFKILCGKGFYVRSLARDLAKKLKTFGHISYLEREKVGKFHKDNSILLDDLIKIGQRQIGINRINSSISMLDDILAYEVANNKDILDLSFGRPIKLDLRKFVNSQSINLDKKLIFLSRNGDIVSFGKLIGNLFKPNKILI